MSSCPNKRLRDANLTSLDYYGRGNNQIYRSFRTAFDTLLTREYYEGTEFGIYYNTFVEDREGHKRSEIYIEQEEIEKVIREEIIENDLDLLKYLVGYMGVGKTTLIRNMFRVFNRSINEFDDNLVIYISFYAMSADAEDRVAAVRNVIRSALDMAITYLSGFESRLQRIKHEDNDFYIKFERFIEFNNPGFAHSIDYNNELMDELAKSECFEKEYLRELYKRDPIDYLLTLMKYYLSQGENTRFNNVIIIVDDLETQPIECIDEILHMVMHINKCMKGIINRSYKIKQLVSLRSYTFRQCDCTRILEALRIDSSNVIIKSEVPALSKIINARMKVIKNKLGSHSFNRNTEQQLSFGLMNAYDSLTSVLNSVNGQYDKMLLNLTHYNLFNAMKLLIRIISNAKYVGKNENENKGGFDFNTNNYDLENKSDNSANPGNKDVFFALAYGTDNIYIDNKDYYLMNILHYYSDEKVNTELLGIYIIQYMLTHRTFVSWKIVNQTDLANNNNYIKFKEFNPIESIVLVEELTLLFDRADSNTFKYLTKGFEMMVKHLYNGGALLQDIKNPVLDDNSVNGRDYKHIEGVRIYLSLRGKQLYDMLNYNSLLLEVYRDDIDTNLNNNSISSYDLPAKERIEYCLDYIHHLFEREQRLISLVGNKKNYIENLGNELAVVVLMKGIRKSIVVYFNKDNQVKSYMMKKYNGIAREINEMISDINRKNNVLFKTVSYIY